MKAKILLFILILAGVLSEATFFSSFKLLPAKPNLLLATAVFAGCAFDLRWALFFGAFCGIMKDCLGVAGPAGINTLLFCFWTFLTVRVSRIFPLDNNTIRLILVSILVIMHSLFLRLVLFISGTPQAGGWVFFYLTVTEAGYTALLLPILFKIFNRIYPLEDYYLPVK